MTNINLQGLILVVLLIGIIGCYLYMYEKRELFANLKTKLNGYKIASGMSTFDGIYDGSLTPQTISNTTKVEIHKILNRILNMVNKKTGMKYMVRKIDRVNVQQLKKGIIGCETNFKRTGEFVLGARYTVDFFSHELKNQHTRRFIVVFVVNKDYDVKVEHISLSNAFNLESKVFNTLEDTSGDNNLILTDDMLEDNNNNNMIMGVNSSNLVFSLFNSEGKKELKTHKRANAYNMGRMFLPQMVQEINAGNAPAHPNLLYPNRKQSKYWDENGVFYTEKESEGKTGVNHSVEERPYQIYDNPTVLKSITETNKNKHHYLFDASRGNIGIPKGQSVM